MKKKLTALLLSVVMCMAVCVPASAVGNTTLTSPSRITAPDPGIQPLAKEVPTTYRNLSSASCSATLEDLAASKSSNTKHFFSTSTNKITMDFDLERSGLSNPSTRELTVTLYKSENGTSWSKCSSMAITWSSATTSVTRSFKNLDNNMFYYMNFKNTTDTSASVNLNISGTILISE